MRKLGFVILAIANANGLPAWAQADASNEIAAIRSEIIALTARLDRLERAQGVADAPPLAAEPVQIPAGEAPALRFSGDLRYRHESINEDTIGERHRAAPARALRPHR